MNGTRSWLKTALVVLGGALAITAGVAYGYRTEIRAEIERRARGPLPVETPRTDIAEEPANRPETDVSPPIETLKPENEPEPTVKPEMVPAEKESPSKSIPREFNLKVPFISQAPLLVWDALHEDACEEASMLMIHSYMTDEAAPSADQADRDIIALVTYQTERYGDVPSISAERAAEIMRERLGLAGTRVLPLRTPDDVRRAIAAGRPVIIPAAGRSLKNPHFKNGGPLYHMLVIKGYRADGSFITNDPGTRFGADYIYDEKTLMAAVHDWNDGDVLSGNSVMIIVE